MTGEHPQKKCFGARRALRTVGALVLAMPGLVHLMGVALLRRWGEPGDLRYADVHPAPGSSAGRVVGGLWLVAMVLFLVTAALLPSAAIAWAGPVVDVAVLIAVAVTVGAVHRQSASTGSRGAL